MLEPVSGFKPLTVAKVRVSSQVKPGAIGQRAASVLDHDGLGEPCGTAVRGQVGQSRSYFSITALDRV